MKKNILYLLTFAILAFACNKNHYYEQYVELPKKKWDIKDNLKFIVPVENNKKFYNIKIALNHDKKYPYKNLWIFIKTTSPSGKSQIDTINCVLADKKYNWRGNCKGSNCYYLQPFADSVVFIEPGNYSFEIIHGLREKIAPNINSVGLIIDKTGNVPQK